MTVRGNHCSEQQKLWFTMLPIVEASGAMGKMLSSLRLAVVFGFKMFPMLCTQLSIILECVLPRIHSATVKYVVTQRTRHLPARHRRGWPDALRLETACGSSGGNTQLSGGGHPESFYLRNGNGSLVTSSNPLSSGPSRVISFCLSGGVKQL